MYYGYQDNPHLLSVIYRMATALECVRGCRVCTRPFVNPKLLTCHHSFCEACIQNIKQGLILKCPVCRTVCHVNQIVADFRLEEFLSALRQQENELTQLATTTVITGSSDCELCGDNFIQFRCEECEQWMCSHCRKIHYNCNATKCHRIHTLLAENGQCRKTLIEETRKLDAKILQLQNFLEILQSEITKTSNTCQYAHKEAAQIREKLITTLTGQSLINFENRFADVYTEIETYADVYFAKLQAVKVDHDKTLDALQSDLSKIECMLEENNPQLAIESGPIVERMHKLLRGIKTPIMHFDSVVMQVRCSEAQGVELVMDGGDIIPQHGGASLKRLLNRQWTQERKIDFLPSRPHTICLINGHLWVSHCHGISIYDDRLEKVRTIQCGPMGDVYDVAVLPSGELVAATVKGLYHINNDGDVLAQIAVGLYTGVVYHEGRIYAVHCTEGVLHVYEHSMRWHQHHSFPVQSPEHWIIITVRIGNGQLYVCLGMDNKIDVYSLSGQLLHTYGCPGVDGSGRLNNPSLCYIDSDNMALVADRENDRLQLLSSEGGWQIIPMVLGKPYSALLLGAQLYVTSWADHSISLYTVDDASNVLSNN